MIWPLTLETRTALLRKADLEEEEENQSRVRTVCPPEMQFLGVTVLFETKTNKKSHLKKYYAAQLSAYNVLVLFNLHSNPVTWAPFYKWVN